jgi:hypothetical protein
MGGAGSTRWGAHYQRRVAAEDRWMISTSKLKRAFSELPQASSGSLWAVKIATGKLKRVKYSIEPRGSDSGEPLLKLSYNRGETRVELPVEPYSHPAQLWRSEFSMHKMSLILEPLPARRAHARESVAISTQVAYCRAP